MKLSKIFSILSLILGLSVWAANSDAAAPSQTATFTLSWTDNSNNEDNFRVYRCTGAACNPTTILGTVAPNVVTFVDPIAGDPGGVVYGYAVDAINKAGASAKTPTVYGTTPTILLPPTMPAGVTVTVTVSVTTP